MNIVWAVPQKIIFVPGSGLQTQIYTWVPMNQALPWQQNTGSFTFFNDQWTPLLDCITYGLGCCKWKSEQILDTLWFHNSFSVCGQQIHPKHDLLREGFQWGKIKLFSEVGSLYLLQNIFFLKLTVNVAK